MKTTADRIESSLDDALDMTFPASDPIAVFMPVDTAKLRIERLATTRSRAAIRADSTSTGGVEGSRLHGHR